MSENLKPCPFCGGTDLQYGIRDRNRWGWLVYVWCDTCGIDGPWICVENTRDIHRASEPWNRRNTVTLTERETGWTV